MIGSGSARNVANLAVASALTIFLGACSSMSLPSLSSSSAPVPAESAVAPEMPATIRSDEIVGRWGLASFQNPNDRARTEKWFKKYAVMPPELAAALAKASDIPVDVDPEFDFHPPLR